MNPQIGKTNSLEHIRSQFPALERIHNDFPVAYFDGPGGTQIPRGVVEAMTDYLYHHNANTHWCYPTSNETDLLIDESRQIFADFFNASPDEVVFGQNMTSLTFHLGRSLGRAFNKEDEIIVTELDHHANVDTWRSLKNDRGVTIRVLPMDIETGQLELARLPSLLNEKTRLVAVGAASNAIGTISDVTAVCELARETGALSFVDAVHFAPHRIIDVKAIGCDFLTCSAYKFYGPHIGILYGRKELLETIDFPKLRPAPNTAPERVETGTQSHESIVGAGAAVDFIASLGHGISRREKLANAYAQLHKHDLELTAALWNGLSALDGVRIYGPGLDVDRTSLVSFNVDNYSAADVGTALAEKAVFVSCGDFYAATVMERLGVGEHGVVRAGCSCYSTLSEVERLVDAVKELTINRN